MDKSLLEPAPTSDSPQELDLTIQLNETGSAGLGLSVKGKTDGRIDRGIFVKNVITGGACYRVGLSLVTGRGFGGNNSFKPNADTFV